VSDFTQTRVPHPFAAQGAEAGKEILFQGYRTLPAMLILGRSA
jgi:hypothetical protein